MAVEHVARIRFAAWRAAEQQRQLAVGDGLLAQVVVDDEGVLAAEHVVLGHRGARVGGDVLQRSGETCTGHDHGCVIHRAGFAKPLDDAGDGRFLLADRDVEALHAGVALVDDRVDADGGFAGLPVADDELALAAADWRHRVDGFDAGLQRLAHRRHARRRPAR